MEGAETQSSKKDFGDGAVLSCLVGFVRRGGGGNLRLARRDIAVTAGMRFV